MPATYNELYRAATDAFCDGKFDRHSGISGRSLADITGLEVDYEDGQTEALAKHLTERLKERKVEKVKEAAAVIYGFINCGGDSAVVDGLMEHRYLMDQLAWAMLKSINKFARYNEDEFDGRISRALQNVIKDAMLPVRFR